MGIAISHWRLARAVSLAGQLGVVSGTAIDTVLVRRLQDGDPQGHVRRALAACPWPDLAADVLARYFQPGGREPEQPYAILPMWTTCSGPARQALGMLGGFVETWLAKAGHAGRVGINLLTKVALPNLAVLYGAMRAGVDVVLMGAGIPQDIPGALDRLADDAAAQQRFPVVGHADAPVSIGFNPRAYGPPAERPLGRPDFFPIISSHTLATFMARKANGSIQGFIIEAPTAGGHNAPPRGGKQFDETGQPLYGDRDRVDFDAVAALGYPFWLAGGAGTSEGFREARARGAVGIQVGTLFAYCEESGMDPAIRQQVRQAVRAGDLTVRSDPLASPTGFPFKVVGMAGTLSDAPVYEARRRRCELGYLREGYADERGQLHFRCAAEPVQAYVAKGGLAKDAADRKCLCNGLMATAGFAQPLGDGGSEPSIVTSGDGIHAVRDLLAAGGGTYSARDVIAHLLASSVSQTG